MQNNEEGIEIRELRNLEFKEIVSSGSLKTVSAFANYGGGTILFGVDDGGCNKAAEMLADVNALPNGISEQEYLNNSTSVRRNPVLANVFYRLGTSSDIPLQDVRRCPKMSEAGRRR